MIAAALLATALATCSLSDDRISESSGVAVVGDLTYTHNDSGHPPVIYALDRSCRTVGTHRLTGGDNVDWEDLARGPDEALYVGDIGDNLESRTNVVVYRVDAPGRGEAAVRAQAIPLTYEDGPHDAEALLVHPRTGAVYVVTKEPLTAGVYEAARGDTRLRRVATLSFSPTGTRGGPDIGLVAQLVVTGGDIAPDASRVALRTYTDLYEWPVAGGDVVAALRDGEPVRTALPVTRQGEAVGYLPGGDALVVTAEGAGAAVTTVRAAGFARASATPTPSTPAPTATAGRTDPADGPWWRFPGAGFVAAGLLLALIAVAAGARRWGDPQA